jgi:hypothetical protein
MKRARSISYAPMSYGRIRSESCAGSTSRAAWTLCRKFEAFPVRDNAMLEHWTEQGRVRPDDYLVSLDLDLCVQARDVAELEVIFRKTRARLFGKVWRWTACAAILLVWVQPLLGATLLVSAIAAATLWSRTIHRPQTCSLYGTDRILRARRMEDCEAAALERSA